MAYWTIQKVSIGILHNMWTVLMKIFIHGGNNLNTEPVFIFECHLKNGMPYTLLKDLIAV